MNTVAYLIPEQKYEGLAAKVEKLGRRAVKLGLEAPSLVVWAEVDKPLVVSKAKDPAAQAEVNWREKPVAVEPHEVDLNVVVVVGYRRYLVVELVGETPRIPDWELIAVVEHTTDSEIGNVLRVAPGQACPVEYRKAEPRCDHCKSVRRRLETFVLRNTTDGKYVQVGRNCLADWCRNASFAEGLVAASQWLSDASDLLSDAESDEEGFSGGGRAWSIVGLEEALEVTCRLVRHFGWVSRKAASESYKAATADMVSTVSFDPKWRQNDQKYGGGKLSAAVDDVQEKDRDVVLGALEWVRSKRAEADSLSDYVYNLLVVCSKETVESRHLGLACSLVGTYLRELGELEAKKGPKALDEHFGTAGKRADFVLTVLSVTVFDSQYGARTLYRFRDQDGRPAIWWTSGQGLEIGETYQVKGTVKAHGEYKGRKQTELSRCKVGEKVEAGEATVAS